MLLGAQTKEGLVGSEKVYRTNRNNKQVFHSRVGNVL